MFKAEITFSNNEKIIVRDDQLIFPISRYIYEDKLLTSKSQPFQLWAHIHNGLVPCLTELLVKYDFFELEENCGKVYKSSAVVSIENL